MIYCVVKRPYITVFIGTCNYSICHLCNMKMPTARKRDIITTLGIGIVKAKYIGAYAEPTGICNKFCHIFSKDIHVYEKNKLQI